MSEVVTRKSEQVVKFVQQMDSIINGFEKMIEGVDQPLGGERYITDYELSKRLRVSRKTLQGWRNSRKIEHIKLDGKVIYAESAVQRLLDECRVEACS